MSRVASKSRPLPRWRITRIKASPAVELGTVEAPDADTAIRVAIKEFEVTNPEHQMRPGRWDYLAKHRVSAAVKRAVKDLEAEMGRAAGV